MHLCLPLTTTRTPTHPPNLVPVSWQHGSSHPSGQLAEKATTGDLSIQSKRGNTITKSAKPDDPAVHLARSGNDVVKNQSELQVDEKTSKDGPADSNDNKNNDEESDAPNGTPAAKTGDNKRKATSAPEGETKPKSARGRPKGVAAPKKEKPDPKAKKEKVAKPAGNAEGEKKARGRPKKEGGEVKEKKERKEPKAMKAERPATGVGKRTRSGRK